MKLFKQLFFLLFLISVIACSDDDSSGDSSDDNLEDTEALNAEREESTMILTSGTERIWRIDQGTLTNNGNVIDITTNFNVVDDEFVFGGTGENGTLVWNRGFDIRSNATSSQETLIDLLVAPIVTTFSYEDDSSTVVNADFGTCTFEINEDNSLNASITNEDGSVFDFTLLEKTAEDFLRAPEGGLNFTQAFTFESDQISNNAPGMIGSYSDNNFYIVTRESGLENGGVFPERILRFDIATNTVTENLFFQSDFVSKQLHIFGDRLVVVGGQFVNDYDINNLGDPISTAHGRSLSRFGTSVQGNDIFIIGGDLDEIEGDQVFRWNLETQTLDNFATLPEPRSGARSAIIDDNLYIFGGTTAFISGDPSNTIFRVNLNTPTQIDTFELDRNINFTWAHAYQNLIYLAGQIIIEDEDGNQIGREATIGIFNTLDNTYQELDTNLTNPSGSDTIHQMCIFNNQMYIIYGNQGEDNGGQFNEWEVLVSDL